MSRQQLLYRHCVESAQEFECVIHPVYLQLQKGTLIKSADVGFEFI